MNKSSSFSTQFFKYWEILLSHLFKYSSRCYVCAEGCSPIHFQNGCTTLAKLGQSYHNEGGKKGIICTVTPFARDVERAKGVLMELEKERSSAELRDWAVGELLSKVFAYRNLQKGWHFSLPIMEGSSVAPYVVDQVFNLWRQVKAFGLLSTTQAQPPILLFRGTEFSITSEGGRASIISDLDPEGPGWRLFMKGRRGLEEWLQTHCRRGLGARVMGHSLGGAMAAYMLIEKAELMSKRADAPSYLFNAPGVSEYLAEKWEALEEKPAFKGFVARGDLVSKVGRLFGTLYECSTLQRLSPVRAHEMLHFAEEALALHPIDIERENRSDSRRFYSQLQKQTTSAIYHLGLKFLFPNT